MITFHGQVDARPAWLGRQRRGRWRGAVRGLDIGQKCQIRWASSLNTERLLLDQVWIILSWNVRRVSRAGNRPHRIGKCHWYRKRSKRDVRVWFVQV